MGTYSIQWKASAVKDLRRLDRQAVHEIHKAIEELASDPFCANTLKMKGTEHSYRLRVGHYRVIYSVYQSILAVEIVRVGHRKDVYRRSDFG